MNIIIDVDKCCGAGHCVRSAPTVFDQDDDGIVVLLQASPHGAESDAARAAADQCPTWAIQLTETEAVVP
jgi:ferredoxin